MVGNWARESWERDSESELPYEHVVMNTQAASGCSRPGQKGKRVRAPHVWTRRPQDQTPAGAKVGSRPPTNVVYAELGKPHGD